MIAVCLTGCGSQAAEGGNADSQSGSAAPNIVHSADDLEGKKIGTQLGTTGYILAADIKDAKVEPYNKGADAVQALKQGKIDAVIIDSEPATSPITALSIVFLR